MKRKMIGANRLSALGMSPKWLLHRVAHGGRGRADQKWGTAAQRRFYQPQTVHMLARGTHPRILPAVVSHRKALHIGLHWVTLGDSAATMNSVPL